MLIFINENFSFFCFFQKKCTIFALELYADKNQTKKSDFVVVRDPNRTPCMVDIHVNRLLLRRLQKGTHETI